MLDLVVYVVVTAFLSWGLGRAVTQRPFPRIARPSYRGVNLNPLLGVVATTASVWVILWSLAARAIGGRWDSSFAIYAWLVAAVLLVALAGFVDDLSEGGARGLRGHLESALRGRPTTGLLKVIAALVAGVLVVLAMPSRPVWVAAAGVALMAGCANVWNDLDVAPGRAGKFFLCFGVVLPFLGSSTEPQVLLGMFAVAEASTLGFDLRERGMLGDSGANVLGLLVGAGLYGLLPDWAIAAAAAIVIGLNVVAETVTFTRVIDAGAPLRWFDRLGTSVEWRTFSANRRSE
jgi:UDP-GlcNAc:undecaprenyl-phosphate GlcNAc-1-phosphate transferase